jgi:predicted transcriptional regulator
MKTTIELPDALGRRAKMLAAERRTTLRALVVEGLERVVADGQASSKDRAKKLFAAMDKAAGITAAKRLNRNEANAR